MRSDLDAKHNLKATTYTVKGGNLVVDIVDGAPKKVVWRGEASGTVSENPQKNATRIQKVVAKMFKSFPPAKK